jgi:CARDB
MERTARIALGTLAIVAIAAATGAADPPRASLRSPVCVTALDPASRAIGITAVMRPLADTRKMQLKPQLLSRPNSASPYTRVRGGDLNSWVPTPDPTLGQQPGDVWNFIKQVVRLKAPATYRFRVFFRWIGTHGQVLGTAVHTGPTCYQPELRPDLQVRTISVEAVAGRPDVNAYVALILNAGESAAGPFEVQFSDGDVPPKTRTVSRLAAHSSIKERFIGPLCTAGTATVTADPTNEVDDLNRANNTLSVVCSAAPGSGLHGRVVFPR